MCDVHVMASVCVEWENIVNLVNIKPLANFHYVCYLCVFLLQSVLGIHVAQSSIHFYRPTSSD